MRFLPLWPFFKRISVVMPLSMLGLLWLPNLLATYSSTEAGNLRFFEAATFGAFFWILIFAALGRLWLVLLVAVPVALVWPLEVWVRVTTQTPINQNLVAIAWETNWAESSNFLAAYGFGLVILGVAWFALYVAGLRYARQSDFCWQHRSRFWCIAIVLPLILLLAHDNDRPTVVDSNNLLKAMDDSGVKGWGFQWIDVFPVNLLVSYQYFRQQLNQLETVRATMMGLSLQARQAPSQDHPEVVVLVIGESASAVHWGMLGYSRNTTPLLAKKRNLAVFWDVVALSTATRTAVPGVLSRRPVLQPDGRVNAKAEPSLLKAFAEVGYQTHWLSNQAPLGKNDTSISVYARDADDVRFLNPGTYETRTSYDEVLLPPLSSILAKPGKHLIVLHLLGSHFDYSMRYPSQYDYFKPSLQSADAVLPSSLLYKEQVENSYDNSVRYTDYVLNEVLAAVEKRGGNSLVAYFSDHGTDPVLGHCAATGASRRGENTFRVPAFVWFSDAMRATNRTQWEQLETNMHAPYRTRAIFSTLLDLSGISIENGLPNENFLSVPVINGSGRMVSTGNGDMANFDAAVKRNACIISPL